MKISEQKIKDLGPCREGWEWYQDNKKEDLLTLCLSANEKDSSWPLWLLTKLMNQKQCVQLAIYAALEVIEVFEKKFPDDKRPRKAIEAAQACCESKNACTARVAAYAADASRAAARTAYAARNPYTTYTARVAAYTARAAYVAAYAADAAITAADASARVAHATARTAAYAVDSKEQLQGKIIHEAVRILEEKDGD